MTAPRLLSPCRPSSSLIPPPLRWLRSAGLLCLGMGALCAATLAQAQSPIACANDTAVELRADIKDTGLAVPADTARANLLGIVRLALARSNAIGASKLLTEAAAIDVDEVRATRWPLVTANGFIGGLSSEAGGLDLGSGKQGRVGLNLSMPVLDGGRTSDLINWRTNLAEAARLGQISAEEQVALQTVSLAIERSRYRLQVRVYQRFARKMACLVEGLETIVRADKGRASELVQAQKTYKQAELSQVQTTSAVRQIEARLQRLVGDDLPDTDGLAAALLELPALQDLMAQAESAPDIAQIQAQASAAEAYTQSLKAQRWPQVNFVAGGAEVRGLGNAANTTAGFNVTMPILNLPIGHAISASGKRAEAVRLQRAEALQARKYRFMEVHEQATSAFDRARRVVEVLKDSERVRVATLQQWQQLGRRSLFDVMGAESEHYGLRVSYVNALYDGQQSIALLWSLGPGVQSKLR